MGVWCFKIINILNFFVVEDKNKYFFNFFLNLSSTQTIKAFFLTPPPSSCIYIRPKYPIRIWYKTSFVCCRSAQAVSSKMTDANTKPDFIARSACNWLTQLDVSTNYIHTYMSGAYSRFCLVGGLNILPERQNFLGVSPPLEQGTLYPSQKY